MSESPEDALPNDRWVGCDLGHQHWGAAGAAGLLIRHVGADGSRHVLLQHRALWVDHGDTWGIPSGATSGTEGSYDSAVREALEELGGLPEDLVLVGSVVDDHGGWAFTTHVVETRTLWVPPPLFSDEVGHDGTQWFLDTDVPGLRLHPGFRATWCSHLRDDLLSGL